MRLCLPRSPSTLRYLMPNSRGAETAKLAFGKPPRSTGWRAPAPVAATAFPVGATPEALRLHASRMFRRLRWRGVDVRVRCPEPPLSCLWDGQAPSGLNTPSRAGGAVLSVVEQRPGCERMHYINSEVADRLAGGNLPDTVWLWMVASPVADVEKLPLEC